MKKLVGLVLAFSLLTTPIVGVHTFGEEVGPIQNATSSIQSWIQEGISKTKEKDVKSTNSVGKFLKDKDCRATLVSTVLLAYNLVKFKPQMIPTVVNQAENLLTYGQKCIETLKSEDNVNNQIAEQIDN